MSNSPTLQFTPLDQAPAAQPQIQPTLKFTSLDQPPADASAPNPASEASMMGQVTSGQAIPSTAPTPQPMTGYIKEKAQQVIQRTPLALVIPPQNANEHVAEGAGGTAGLVAYRMANQIKSLHDSVVNAKSGDEFWKAKSDFQNATLAWILGHKHEAILHALSGGSDVASGTEPMLKPLVTDNLRETSEAASQGDYVPAAANAITLGTMLAVPDVAKGLGAAEAGTAEAGTAEAAETGAATETAEAASKAEAVTPKAGLTPVEAKVAQGVTKSGLKTGTPATVAPTGEDIQPALQSGVRDYINKVNKQSGLAPVSDDVSIMDAAQKQADAFQARSQATFDKVKEITGVDPTTLKQIMRKRSVQIENAVAAGNDEEAGNLQQLQLQDENRVVKAFDDAKAQNVSVDQARSDWNKSLRADELSSAIRGSKSNTSTLKNPNLDPNKLTPRLQKLAESQPGGKAAKLSQLGGDDAETLVEHAENARLASQEIKDFVPATATGKNALQGIIQKNTTGQSSIIRGGKVVGKTDWNGVVKDFENLGADGQIKAFGADVPRVRQFLERQALKQNAADMILGKTTAGKILRGAVAEEAVRRSF